MSSTKPVRYESAADICRRAGLSKVAFWKAASGIWCPKPDIYVGVQAGWKPERAERWLKETGRIDVHGNPSRASRVGRPRKDEDPPEWYRTVPVRYLTASEAARVVRRERKTVGRMRSAGAPWPVAVVVGSQEGYDIRDVIHVALQYGWILPASAPLVLERWERIASQRDREAAA